MSSRNRRLLFWSGLGAAGLAGVLGGAWIVSLPADAGAIQAPSLDPGEAESIVDGLKPRKAKGQRPVIAIVGINDATEVTDYVMPYGILRRSGIADVVLLATEPGVVKLYPALAVEPQDTIAGFDAKHPGGADYVIVPAMSRDDDPAVLRWLNEQSAKDAFIIGVCVGATVVGEAGLLHGKRATTHWYSVDELRKDSPSMHYVPDRRLVVDEGVATTTGITASMPMALTLIEAIGGREKAEAVGREIGVVQWDARHASDAFRFTRPFALGVIANTLAFWNREEFGIELVPGVDEVSLALVADAWSRTYRSRAVTFSKDHSPSVSRNGLRIVPDRITSDWRLKPRLPAIGTQPARALDEALDGIATRYGAQTHYVVAMQLEYPAGR